MRCPFCNQDNTRVVDSRPVEDTNSIRRRRLCDACGKRFMIDSIEGDIFRSEDREISSTKIGEIVMEHLKDLDAVAYVRFASVYREFKDVSTFMDELKKLIN